MIRFALRLPGRLFRGVRAVNRSLVTIGAIMPALIAGSVAIWLAYFLFFALLQCRMAQGAEAMAPTAILAEARAKDREAIETRPAPKNARARLLARNRGNVSRGSK